MISDKEQKKKIQGSCQSNFVCASNVAMNFLEYLLNSFLQVYELLSSTSEVLKFSRILRNTSQSSHLKKRKRERDYEFLYKLTV